MNMATLFVVTVGGKGKMWSPQIEDLRRSGLLAAGPRQYDNVLQRFSVGKEDSFSLSEEFDYVPIFACRFAEAENYKNILAVANENGAVAIQDTNLLNNPQIYKQQCHQNAVFDVAWMPKQMKFVTASGDHSSKLWDFDNGSFKEVSVFFGHSKSVKTTVFRKDDPYVFATGARDGKILIWDIRIPQKTVLKPDNAVCNCHAFNTPLSKRNNKNITNNRSNTITGLVFQNDATLISCGAGDGSIKVWDLRKNYSAYKKDPLPKHSIPYCGSSSKSGYANLLLDDAGIRLYANCMDSVIYCFNVSTYSVVPEQRYIGHENNSFYIKSSLSSDSNYLVSGSSNEKAYIWNVQYSEPIVSLNGHVAEVTCASWCQNGDLKIVTCGDDSRYNIWRIGKEFPDANDAIEIHGKAETVTSFEKQGKSPWGILEKTPQSSRSKYATSSHSSSRKIRINTPSNSDYYYGTSVTKRTSKRSLFNIENIKEVEEGEPSKIFKCDSSKENNWNTANLIPTSQNVNDMCCTPKKIVIDNVLDSPTANLPNFNINGEAPHQRLMSPLKNTVSNVDWLTKIRQSKLSSSEKNPANSDMKQRNSTSKQTPDVNKTPGRHKSKPTLLDYFSPNRKPETN